jgi:hypothetical protein
MTEMTRAQLFKYGVGAMVDVNMSPTPPKVIGKEVCLRAKGPSELSNDPRPKRHPNILWKEESKEIKDSMKVDSILEKLKTIGRITKLNES